MTTHVFFLNKLRQDCDRDEYERWLREVDYPTARSLSSIEDYRVVRLEGMLSESELPCDYVEIVEISDLDAYAKDIGDFPGRERFLEQLASFVDDAIITHGTVIE
ncbi:hypothetical protein [Haloechinothrix halophila]|uniref:hypothetical protein n=1 Tax=Haloechinothrix halophila TaxID=1069073 RepID=UPI0005593F49|nr:hypothetical protein [Haloechinothrix halophila]